MATNVATLTARLTADTRQLKRGLGKASKDVDRFTKRTTKATGRVKKGFSGIQKAAAGLGLAFGAAVVVRGLNDAINAASNLEESVNAVQVVYEDAAQGVLDLGRNSVEQFGLSRRAVNDAAVGMGAFADKINAADPADAFKNIIQRATDFGSVMNITTEETLDKFRAGLAGESEPLKKFGLDISEATIKQVALDAGIIKTGESMSQGQKIQARYLAIMQQTEKTAGDFANTSDGLAGSQKKLSAAWEEAQVAIGEKLMPAFTDLIQLLTRIAKAGPEAITNITSAVSAAVRKWEIWNSTWSDTDEAVHQVQIRLLEYNRLVDEGINEANVFAGAFVNLQAEGDAYIGTLGALIDKTGISNERLEDSIRILLRNADEYGLTADQVDLLKRELRKLNPIVKFVASSMVKQTRTFRDAEQVTAALRSGIAGLMTIQQELADPVFRAAQATRRYEEALEEANETIGITAAELTELAPLYVEAELASAALTGENISAYNDIILGLAVDVGALPDAVAGAVATLDNLDMSLLDASQRAFLRFATLTAPISVQVRMTAPSRAEVRRVLINELSRLRREGILPATGF